MRIWIGAFLAAVVLLFAGYGTYSEWVSAGQVALPPTAYIALSIGVVATIVLGCGLMALVFFSSRHGYDDRVGHGEHD